MNRNPYLICSKNLLNPVKVILIPSLWLLAVLIGVRAMKFIMKSLKHPAQRSIIWSNSKCVLSWLVMSKALPVFVENRKREMLDIPGQEFRYVPVKENLADFATRECSPRDLSGNTQRRFGPPWLDQEETSWLSNKLDLAWNDVQEDNMVVNVTVYTTNGTHLLDISRFSS